MKKSTKIRLISLFVIGVMALSVFSYAALEILGQQSRAQGQQTQINGFVIKGNVSEDFKQQYIAKGLTFLTVEYTPDTEYLLTQFEGMPDQFKTTDGQMQLVVVEVNGTESKLTLESLNGYEEMGFDDASFHDKICSLLYSPPIECIAANITVPKRVNAS